MVMQRLSCPQNGNLQHLSIRFMPEGLAARRELRDILQEKYFSLDWQKVDLEGSRASECRYHRSAHIEKLMLF